MSIQLLWCPGLYRRASEPMPITSMLSLGGSSVKRCVCRYMLRGSGRNPPLHRRPGNGLAARMSPSPPSAEPAQYRRLIQSEPARSPGTHRSPLEGTRYPNGRNAARAEIPPVHERDRRHDLCAGLLDGVQGLEHRPACGHHIIDQEHPVLGPDPRSFDGASRAASLGFLSHDEPLGVAHGGDSHRQGVGAQCEPANRVEPMAGVRDPLDNCLAGQAEVLPCRQGLLAVDEVRGPWRPTPTGWVREDC